MKTIEMAREAGFDEFYSFDSLPLRLNRLADLIRADEREACAKVCDEQIKVFLSSQYKTGQPLSSFPERHASASCAEAIRARGNK